MQQAERGIFDLRRGRFVFLRPENGTGPAFVAGALEGMTEPQLAELRRLGGSDLRLVLTRHRAHALDLADFSPLHGVSLHLNANLNLHALLDLAAAAKPEPASIAGAKPQVLEVGERAALILVRAALLVPAAVCVPVSPAVAAELGPQLADATLLTVPVAQALELQDHPDPDLRFISAATVPLADCAETRFLLFREGNGLLEHIAVAIGSSQQWPDPVPVRLHSACLTGDLFGSLRCDCGEQLRNSVRRINAAGGGLLLYLAQEGRGIGLANKLRAYTLQDQGMDTLEADCTLGFASDERRFEVAEQMLRHLGITRVSLLTNNPRKLAALREAGIEVQERQPLHGTLNPHNRRYLSTKAERAGHLLKDLGI